MPSHIEGCDINPPFPRSNPPMYVAIETKCGFGLRCWLNHATDCLDRPENGRRWLRWWAGLLSGGGVGPGGGKTEPRPLALPQPGPVRIPGIPGTPSVPSVQSNTRADSHCLRRHALTVPARRVRRNAPHAATRTVPARPAQRTLYQLLSYFKMGPKITI